MYQMYDTKYETKERKNKNEPANVIYNYFNVCYIYCLIDYLVILLININA